jgi:riboflavin synthase
VFRLAPGFPGRTHPVFTGLVRMIGIVAEVSPAERSRRLVLEGALAAEDLTLGASVAIDGVCLTVVAAVPEAGRFDVEAAFETLEKTTLGRKVPGDVVNLEPALRVGEPLGGHLVSGHVDGLSRLRSSSPRGEARELWIDAPPALLRFVAPKGSVCLDGVSLTVNDVDDRGFMVGIIPHTLAVTTLGRRRPGDEMNLEVDLVARYVARLLQGSSQAS